MNSTLKLAALAPVLLLGGCLSLGGETPDSLLTLTPATMAPAGTGGAGGEQGALAIDDFEVPKAIDVTRVPVQVTDTQLAYLQDAVWVERPGRLFRSLLAETIRTRTGRVVIDGDISGLPAADRLQGALRTFGYDARTREAVVTFDAVRRGDAGSVTTRRFESRVPVAVAETNFVGPALNQAANDVAGQVADWLN